MTNKVTHYKTSFIRNNQFLRLSKTTKTNKKISFYFEISPFDCLDILLVLLFGFFETHE
jgi:hypothetical protein